MFNKRLAAIIVKTRYVLLVVFLICTVLSALCISKTKINYDLTKYLSDDTMTKRALAVMEEEFGRSDQLRIMFSDQSEESLADYITLINEQPEVLMAAHDTVSGTTDLDGVRYQLVTVTLNSGKTEDVVRRLRSMFPEAGQYYVGGNAADQLDVQQSVGSEIPQVMLIAVSIVLLMLLVTSHAWLEPAAILMTLAISIVLNMGTNFVFPSVSFITFAVSAILQLALSIDYAIMLLHTFNRYQDSGFSGSEAMEQTLTECFMRITSSAMTTIAGLLSLLFMSFTIGFDIGMVLSKGIVFSMLGVFGFMPAVILLMEQPLRLSRHKPLKLGGEHLAKLITRCKWPVAVYMIMLVLGGLYLNSRIVFSFTGEGTRAGSESSMISEKFGISNPLVILVPGGEEDSDYDCQRSLVEKLQSLSKVDGQPIESDISSMVTTGAKALEYYTAADVAELTGQSILAINLFFRLQGFGSSVRADRLLAAASLFAGGNEQITQLQDQLQTAREAFIGPTKARLLAEVNFTVTDSHSSDYMYQILETVHSVYGEDYYVTGVPMSNYDIANAFGSDLVKVNIITLLSILLIVILSFRSLCLPVLLVFVIEGAIWITMGSSWLTGSTVFFISYLICLSIQMGATIDYGILLSDQYRSLRRSGSDPEKALEDAMKKALPTILTSGVIMVVAGYIIGIRCSIFYISDIGLLVSKGSLISVILVLSLLPAMLLLCDRLIIRTGGIVD